MVPCLASAHHSSAYYAYSDAVTELEGELVSVSWTNPHIGLRLKVIDATRQESVWDLELPGSVYSHERRGIHRDLFQVGNRITVAGHASGRVARRFLTTNILLDDRREIVVRERAGRRSNTELFSGEQAETDAALAQRATTENKGLFRVWSQPLQGDAREIGELPFRQEALAARAQWDPLNNFVTRCELPGMPDLMDSPYPIEFVRHGSWTELRAIGNYQLGSRMVHMSGPADPAQRAGSPMGYSVGHWEGNTLVVHTTHIDWPYFDNRGTPQSSAIEILERFVLSEDQSRLEYEMTVTDSELFTRSAVVTKAESYAALGEAMPEANGCR